MDAVISNMLTYQNMYINQTHDLWMFGEDTILHQMYENVEKTKSMGIL